MRHFPINCPRCDAQSWIRMDRLGKQLHCERCKTLFYLDASGNYAVGNRPADLREPNLFEPVAAPKGAYHGVEFLERVPGPVKLGAAGLIGVVAVAALGRLFSGSPVELPDSLEGRAALVAEAFARDQPERVDLLAAPGDSREVRTWIKKSRPSAWEWGEQETIAPGLETVFQNSRTGRALVLATIAPPGDDPGGSPGAPPEPLVLPLIWLLDDQGRWVLNVSETLREGPRSF